MGKTTRASAVDAWAIENPYWQDFVSKGHSGAARGELRQELVCKYALSVTSPEALQAVANFAPPSGIVEVGAGSGYWSYCLTQMGVKVAAFDHCLVETGENRYFTRECVQWSSVELGEPSVVREYQERALMLGWPPKDSPMASQCLNLYKGNSLIYLGERRNGRTGDRAFHDRLERGWKLKREVQIPKWSTHSDLLFLYTRKR